MPVLVATVTVDTGYMTFMQALPPHTKMGSVTSVVTLRGSDDVVPVDWQTVGSESVRFHLATGHWLITTTCEVELPKKKRGAR